MKFHYGKHLSCFIPKLFIRQYGDWSDLKCTDCKWILKKKKPRSEGDKKILTFPTIIEIKLLYIYKILHTYILIF